MRCQKRIFRMQQRFLCRDRRFTVEHIHRGSRDPSFVQSLCQCFAVHDRSSCAVNENGGLFHQCDLLCTDHASGLLIIRRMQGNNITLSQQVIQRFVCNSCCLHFFSFVSGIGIDFRTECPEKLRCHETDLTAADDSHLFAPDLSATQSCAGTAVSHRLIRLLQITQKKHSYHYKCFFA